MGNIQKGEKKDVGKIIKITHIFDPTTNCISPLPNDRVNLSHFEYKETSTKKSKNVQNE